VETFTSASVDEESGTDTGPANDVVVLRVESSATGMTALQWLESGKMGFSSATHVEKATIDGKDGARIVPNDGSPSLAFVVAARGRMYALSAGIRDQAARPAVIALLSSFHVLSDAELADARATLATPTPAPARSAEAVAQTLETGFAQKEVAAIAPVTGDCVQQALEQAGASFMSSAKFFSDLRTRFANGLAVSVQAAQLVDQQADYAAVRGTWKDPGQPVRNVKLMLRRIGNAWYWDGVLYLQG